MVVDARKMLSMICLYFEAAKLADVIVRDGFSLRLPKRKRARKPVGVAEVREGGCGGRILVVDHG